MSNEEPTARWGTRMSGLIGGISVVSSPHCERPPTDAENARRMVRHGLADVLEWLGEDVGPRPGDPVQVAYLLRNEFAPWGHYGFIVTSPAALAKIVSA